LVFITVFTLCANISPIEGFHNENLLKKVLDTVYFIGVAISFIFATALFVITNKKINENNNHNKEIKE